MHRPAAILAAAFLPLAAHAQPFCDPPPEINPNLTLIVQGTVDLGGETVPVSATMQILRSPPFGCEPASGSISLPGIQCDANGVFLAWPIIPIKVVVWLLKNPSEAEGCINTFDLSCGNLAGTFSMGEGAEQATGSFTAVLVNPDTVNVTFDLVFGNDLPDGAFTGEWTSVENITAGPPGTALATGTTTFQTPDGPPVISTFTVEYELVGNPDVVFLVPLTIRQTADFDCRTGQFTSEVCAFSTASIPTVSEWAMIGMSLLLLTGGTLLIRRRAALGAGGGAPAV